MQVFSGTLHLCQLLLQIRHLSNIKYIMYFAIIVIEFL